MEKNRYESICKGMAAQGEECNGNEWIRAAREKLGVTRPRKGIALIGIERMGNAKEQLSAEAIGRATQWKRYAVMREAQQRKSIPWQ